MMARNRTGKDEHIKRQGGKTKSETIASGGGGAKIK